ncbi:alpha/beta fold hydrolase [Curtobacterium sp. 24E2]|nr:hypothetical protein JN350_14620 [Curtobacterium sp. 24E2]
MLLGRSDDAVKVRGYLVEPSEVEAALRAIPEVHDAVVTAQVDPPAVTRLVAYVVGRPGQRTPAPAALRLALRDRLPEYMVPASIVPMTELPRNERGKVDRAELPGAPSIETEMVEGEYDQWELVVGQIWAEVLGLRGVHLDEDFSALGGDSLSAEEMLALVQSRLGIDLRSSDVLQHPTLRAFARRVRSGTTALPSHPDVVKVSGARESGRPPVFCFAGGGALALTFLPLSRYLPEHDVYAFQQHGLERRGVPDWSIRASARRYVALMRIVQPRGPYLLVGHSLGGLIALEIARLLTESGEQVEHVALLDTYLPRTGAEGSDSSSDGSSPASTATPPSVSSASASPGPSGGSCRPACRGASTSRSARGPTARACCGTVGRRTSTPSSTRPSSSPGGTTRRRSTDGRRTCSPMRTRTRPAGPRCCAGGPRPCGSRPSTARCCGNRTWPTSRRRCVRSSRRRARPGTEPGDGREARCQLAPRLPSACRSVHGTWPARGVAGFRIRSRVSAMDRTAH